MHAHMPLVRVYLPHLTTTTAFTSHSVRVHFNSAWQRWQWQHSVNLLWLVFKLTLGQRDSGNCSGGCGMKARECEEEKQKRRKSEREQERDRVGEVCRARERQRLYATYIRCMSQSETVVVAFSILPPPYKKLTHLHKKKRTKVYAKNTLLYPPFPHAERFPHDCCLVIMINLI